MLCLDLFPFLHRSSSPHWERQGQRPLAASNGQLAAVKLLVQSGADVNKSVAGLSPLFFAARKRHVTIVKFLLEKNAKLTFPDVNREKFLAEVKSFDDPELLRLLKDQL